MYIEKVEDLKKGDEVLVAASSGSLIHAILLRDPAKRKDDKWYKRTKCSICAQTIEHVYNHYDWKTKMYVPRVTRHTKYEKDIVDGPRIDKYMDLQDYKMIWILNR